MTHTTLTDCTISGNVGAAFGGGVGQNAYGTLDLTGCTISGNFAAFGGGGLTTAGTATLTDCTISGNSTNGTGGGVLTSGGAHATPSTTLTNCTVSDNFADHNGGGVADTGPGSSTTLTTAPSAATPPRETAAACSPSPAADHGACPRRCSISGNYAPERRRRVQRPEQHNHADRRDRERQRRRKPGQRRVQLRHAHADECDRHRQLLRQPGQRHRSPAARSRPSNVTVSGNSANNDVADGVVTPAFSALASPAIVYGTPSVTLTGHIGSGTNAPLLSSVAITLDSVTQDVPVDAWGNFSATFDTSSLSVVDGPYTVTYAFAGNTGFTAVTDTSTALTVTPAPLTVTADPNQSMTYGDTPDLTYTYTGLVNGDTGASFTGSLGGATSSSGVGTYAITLGDLAATGNYTIGTFNADTLTVNPAPLTVTVIGVSRRSTARPTRRLRSRTRGWSTTKIPGVLGGTLAVVDADPDPSTAVGSYAGAITASGRPRPITPSSYVAGDLECRAAPLTVTANSVSRVYGAADPALGVSYSGFVNSEDPSVLGGTLAVVDADPATSTAVGTYTGAITASGLTADNYSISYVAGDLSVTPAPLTVTATGKSMTYGGTVPALTYTYTGLVNGNTSATFTGGLATTATSSSNVGSYSITQGNLAATGNYTIGTFNSGTLTANAAKLTVTATNESMTYGGSVPALAYTYTGLVNGGSPTFSAGYSGFVLGQGPSVLSGTLAFSTTTTSSSSAGTYTAAVTATGLTSSNYAISFAAGNMVVSKATPTITWNTPAPITYFTPLSGTQLNAAASWTVAWQPGDRGRIVHLHAGGRDRADGRDQNSLSHVRADRQHRLYRGDGDRTDHGAGPRRHGDRLAALPRRRQHTSNDQVQINPIGTSNTGSTGVQVQTQLNGVNTTTTTASRSPPSTSSWHGGNDNVQIASTLTINAVVTAGNGNDNIQLGNGNNTVTLGNGNDNVQAATATTPSRWATATTMSTGQRQQHDHGRHRQR